MITVPVGGYPLCLIVLCIEDIILHVSSFSETTDVK